MVWVSCLQVKDSTKILTSLNTHFPFFISFLMTIVIVISEPKYGTCNQREIQVFLRKSTENNYDDPILRNFGKMLTINTALAHFSVIILRWLSHSTCGSLRAGSMFYCYLWNTWNFVWHKTQKQFWWWAEVIRSTMAGCVLESQIKTFSFLSKSQSFEHP